MAKASNAALPLIQLGKRQLAAVCLTFCLKKNIMIYGPCNVSLVRTLQIVCGSLTFTLVGQACKLVVAGCFGNGRTLGT